jgi:4-amino-4-deoxy-L-arabinose transferase-like glycosyltransferase
MGRQTGQSTLYAGAALVAGFLLRIWLIHHLFLISGDSLVYGDIAKNLLQHGIYGFTEAGRVPGSIEIRPTLIRLPGYPFFLAACFRIFGMENYRAVLYVQTLADLTTCLFAAATAGRLFGRRAATATLWIAALCPFTATYAAEALTETLVLTSIAAAIYGFLRWQQAGCTCNRWLCVIAGSLAASILLRPEQVLFAAAILGGMLWQSLQPMGNSRPRFASIKPVLVAAALTVLPFVAWTLRNAHTFHLFQPLSPRYANDPGELAPLGFARWYRTWAIDFADTENVYWNYCGDPIALSDLPARAYTASNPTTTSAQYRSTAQLLADYNSSAVHSAGVPPAIDARFAALAHERIHQHPLLYYLELPVARVANMTFRPRVEMLPIPLEWWAWRQHRAQSALAAFYGFLNFAYIAGGIAGLHAWKRMRWSSATPHLHPYEFRALALAMVAAIVLRVALLLTIDNSEPRYTLEFFPVLFVWGAALFARQRGKGGIAEARDN